MIFTVIAFWTGAGGWIIIMYGALNTISADVMEAARIDGAGPLKTAWYIQIPLLRKWIAYMAIIVARRRKPVVRRAQDPQPGEQGRRPEGLLAQPARLPLRLRSQSDFNGSAAISILLLVVATGLAAFFVFRGGLFDRD